MPGLMALLLLPSMQCLLPLLVLLLLLLLTLVVVRLVIGIQLLLSLCRG